MVDVDRSRGRTGTGVSMSVGGVSRERREMENLWVDKICIYILFYIFLLSTAIVSSGLEVTWTGLVMYQKWLFKAEKQCL